MLEKYKEKCEVCKNNNFKIFMWKYNSTTYICKNCVTQFNQLNSEYIFSYHINEIKKSITENMSIDELHKKAEREKHIKKRKQDYLDTLNSVKILTLTPHTDKVKRKFLKDIPNFNYSQVRKNIPQHKLENFVVIDTETTGLKPASDEIIEISAIKFIDSNPVECLTTLVKPKKEIPIEATKINNITNDMVKDSPSIENVINNFNNFIKGFNIVGYNLDFDLRFLHVNGMDFFNEKRQFFDALDLSRKVYKQKLYNFKLDTVAEEMQLYRTQNHRATEDAFVTGIIFRDLGNYIKTH